MKMAYNKIKKSQMLYAYLLKYSKKKYQCQTNIYECWQEQYLNEYSLGMLS